MMKISKDVNTLLNITTVSTAQCKKGELCFVSHSLYGKLILESKITRSINRNLAFLTADLQTVVPVSPLKASDSKSLAILDRFEAVTNVSAEHGWSLSIATF